MDLMDPLSGHSYSNNTIAGSSLVHFVNVIHAGAVHHRDTGNGATVLLDVT